jgi:probable poly-beta-1,6-N-acetyl-D-glucosamine export protein
MMHGMEQRLSSGSTNRSFSEKQYITALKGIAILCVVGIHVLSSVKAPIFTEGLQRYFFITLDQLFRVSVPLFVVLSGFAFARKYQSTAFKVKEFFTSQVVKLIPLYLFWSLLFIAAAYLIPAWFNPTDNTNWWQILFMGKADYHLYFIPMIFQLYVLFPVLRFAMQKSSPSFVLAVACAIQIALYVHISEGLSLGNSDFFFRKDQQQYIFAFSWIGYFALGMWLATVKMWQANKNAWLRYSIPILFVASFFLLVTQTLSAIFSAVDPIVALRFTRLPVIFFAFVSILALFEFSSGLHFSRRFINTLVKIGEFSFLIYLSHTLVLRIFFLGYRGVFTMQDLLIAVGLLVLGVLLSSKWMNLPKKKLGVGA